MARDLEHSYAERLARDGLTDDAAQRAALAVLDDIRRGVEAAAAPARGLWRRRRPAPPGGLYLWGPVGRGKSMLVELFHEAVQLAAKRRVHFHQFMQEVHAALEVERRRGTRDPMVPVAAQVAEGARLLCLDELEVTDIADAMIVGRFFALLLSAGVTVVITSNRPPEDLYRDGLNRALFEPFIALIRKRLIVWELDGGEDYRRAVLAAGRCWFDAADPAARARMDALWERLSGGRAAPMTLHVQGRELVLPACASGVGRAGFADLCERPLGKADYLALASVLRVLFLDDVPRLGRARADAARRFVTLVDALYENRVRLVVSAEAEPDALHVEGEGAFEFARTASRLIELTAAD